MAIINALNNQIQIHKLDTSLDTGGAPGKGDVLLHPNGNTYVIWSQSVDGPGQEMKSLYLSWSSDGGNSWAPRLQLTSGTYDDRPSFCLLNRSDVNSDLAIVFNRAIIEGVSVGSLRVFAEVYRFTCSTAGAITSPIDNTNTGHGIGSTPFVINLPDGGYLIARLSNNTSGSANFFYNDSFVLNSWTENAPTSIPDLTAAHNFRLRLLSHSNQLALIYTGYDASNGFSTDNSRSQLYIIFSGDDGHNWSSAQQLTRYSTPTWYDQIGWPSAYDADVTQLSDGTISVLLQEYTPMQSVGQNPAPNLASGSSAALTSLDYNAVLGCSAIAYNSSTFGLYITVLSAASQAIVRRFTTASSPQALWSNVGKQVVFSPSGAYVALVTDSSLEIFATNNDREPLNWTLYSLRATTTPALTSTAISGVQFVDSSRLVVMYAGNNAGNTTGTVHIGDWLDCALLGAGTATMNAINVTGDPYSTFGASIPVNQIFSWPTTQAGRFVYVAKGVRLGSGSMLRSVNIDDPSWNYTIQDNNIYGNSVVYDPINSEYVCPSSDSSGGLLTRIKDNGPGTGFTLEDYYRPLSLGNSFSNLFNCVGLPGGILIQNLYDSYYPGYLAQNAVYSFYSFAQRKYLGTIVDGYQFDPLISSYQVGWENGNYEGAGANRILASGKWFSTGNGGDSRIFALFNTGRLRQASYSYDPVALSLHTSGVNFYDVATATALGSSRFNSLAFPRIAALPDDTLMLYGVYWNLADTQRPLTTFVAQIQTASERLQVKASILNTEYNTLSLRSRLRAITNQVVSVQGRLVRTQSVSARASIIPRQTKTLQMRASVYGTHADAFTGSFTVLSASALSIRTTFYAQVGHSGSGTFSCVASIAASVRHRLTGHFVVPATARTGSTQSLAFALTQRTIQPLAMGANIV